MHRTDPLAELGKKYRASLPAKRAAIDEAWRRFMQHGEAGDDYKDLATLVHRLAGSGASYGYIEISEYAIRFEDVLDDWLAKRPPERGLDFLAQALEELRQAIDRAHARGPDE